MKYHTVIIHNHTIYIYIYNSAHLDCVAWRILVRQKRLSWALRQLESFTLADEAIFVRVSALKQWPHWQHVAVKRPAIAFGWFLHLSYDRTRHEHSKTQDNRTSQLTSLFLDGDGWPSTRLIIDDASHSHEWLFIPLCPHSATVSHGATNELY